jgi:hypothetical protein
MLNVKIAYAVIGLSPTPFGMGSRIPELLSVHRDRYHGKKHDYVNRV